MKYLANHSFWIIASVCAVFSFSISSIVTSFIIYFIGLDRGEPEFNGISVLIGSVSTAVTFAFLILQNVHIRKQQEAANYRQEKLEERQNELWETQQVNIKFEMYQAHKREFFSVLDDIEKSSKMTIEFYDREKLYRNIFPKNSFSNVHFHIDIRGIEYSKTDDLEAINYHYNIIIEQYDLIINHKENENKPENKGLKSMGIDIRQIEVLNFINSLELLLELLHVTVISKNDFGDICSKGHDGPKGNLLLNLYDLKNSLNVLDHVFKNIMAFTSNSDITDTPSFYIDYNFIHEVHRNLFNDPTIQNLYDFNLDENGYAIGLFKFYDFYWFPEEEVLRIKHDLDEFVYDNNKIKELVSDFDKLEQKINYFHDEFRLIMKQLPDEKVQEFYSIYKLFDSLYDHIDDSSISLKLKHNS
ncbi:hypothetical protein PE36_12852 [Moritella sp. PE36]|nr:hypothetical protein PE36_12852 [Moritella sp. PE36]